VDTAERLTNGGPSSWQSNPAALAAWPAITTIERPEDDLPFSALARAVRL
jgi:hypothetical protein